MPATNKNRGRNVIDSGKVLEFIETNNITVGQDGNYRKEMVNGKLQIQKRIAGVWTAMEEI